MDLLEVKAQQDLMDLLDLMVQLDLMDRQGLQEVKARKALLEQPVIQVVLDQLVQPQGLGHLQYQLVLLL